MRLTNEPYANGKVHLDMPVSDRVPKELIEEIIRALRTVGGYGSIEIYVQDHSVTQITVRNIRKTKHFIEE